MLDPAFQRKMRRRDAIARVGIVAGGIAVVACVLGIVVQIVGVAAPLFRGPAKRLEADWPLPAEATGEASRVLGVGLDDHLETAYVLLDDGSLVFLDVSDGSVSGRERLRPPGDPSAKVRSAALRPPGDYSLLWSDGSFSLERVAFAPVFDAAGGAGGRAIEPRVTRRMEETFDASRGGDLPLRSIAVAPSEEVGGGGGGGVREGVGGSSTRVDLLPGNRLRVVRRVVSESLLGDSEESVEESDLSGDLPGEVTSMALDGEGRTLHAATSTGWLLRWDLSDPGGARLLDRVRAVRDGRAIPAVGLVFGDTTLAVGDASGGVTGWFPVTSKRTGGRKALTRVHELPAQGAGIRAILPTRRNRAVLVLDAAGRASLDHVTSERRLLRFDPPHPPPLRLVNLNARADGLAAVDGGGRLLVWRLDLAYPEVSWKTLFGKVWYEGYDEPVYAWQSSSASADYEPKLSLVPLMFGTLKGTLYAMLFAVPLAVLGALYTSQFLHRGLRGILKPAIEVMAAIPSVVIGFLAALWFAPILEGSFGGIVLALVLLPAMVLGSAVLWEAGLGERLRRFRRGFEFLLLVPSLLLGLALALALGGFLEKTLFGGDLRGFLFSQWGVRYDPRNSIVISFALGFAVIPIVFSMAEDALSNVPRSLGAGSLALGASRWQTAWRVVLPGAAPGIFAAVMIGLGRAIGETMIVLMATGNTAILDWSPFDGMRTISANIATEAPEAPYLGVLYRVLFLSAVILFAATFALNTVAEIVRRRIRRKYARF